MPSMRIKAINLGEITQVQALMQHPMDSGFVKDEAGMLIPPHHIETLIFLHNDKPVFTAYWGPAVAKDPYVKFSFKGGAKGDTLSATWIDNLGQTDTGTATIA